MGFFSRITGLFSKPETAAPADTQWQSAMLEALNAAEPHVQAWAGIVLDGQGGPGPELWERLEYFLKCLDIPEQEAENFTRLFRNELESSGAGPEDIKPALCHRLALALDMKEEEVCRDDLRMRLNKSLARTRRLLAGRLDGLLGHSSLDQAFWDDLTETLIMADAGHQSSAAFAGRLKKRAARAGITKPDQLKEHLFAEMDAIFRQPDSPAARPEVVLMAGINGVGKTTTVAKLAHRAKLQGRKTLIAAADTFRAAAIEQLEIWSIKTNVDFYAKTHNADPAAVAYEAVEKAVKEGHDLLLIDTAGRLHTKAHLMEELAKIKRVIAKRLPGAPHRTILALDATTGQNALSQAALFQKSLGLTEVIMTKLDGTAKGGVLLAAAMQFGLPVSFVGMGEKMEDLRHFKGRDFAEALLGL